MTREIATSDPKRQPPPLPLGTPPAEGSAAPCAALPAPPADQRALCLQILERGDLASKLVAPFDAEGRPLPAGPPGPPVDLDRPARDPGLRMRGGRERLPRPGALADAGSRRLCLARFAHHELMAVEYFAWAWLRWPDAPAGLLRGWIAAMADEQRHCRLYLDRLAALGGQFDGDGHSDYFWRHAPAIASSPAGPAAFLAAMGLTLEQANLDFTLTYRDAFAAAGDSESAALCQRVHDDEVAHVALAARWLPRVAARETARIEASAPAGCADPNRTPRPQATDLEDYLVAVPFPLGPARAKGRRFEAAPRRRAGLSDAFIDHVRRARSSQERAASAPTGA